MATTLTVTGDIGRRLQLGMMRSELAHVLRRRQGLIGAEGLVVLARAEGLSDVQIRNLVGSWEARLWPRR
jgi:hypothetical protein